MRIGAKIPDKTLDHPVTGLRLTGHTLREQLGSGRTLLLFLRHLG